MHNNICIIPARGGSKRIPRKNIKDFLGKPIIAYSIEAAIRSGLFNEVMVSTDDKEIAEAAIKYGAKVPFFRSDKNANDFATTYDVLEEVLESSCYKGMNFENACCIYPCAPLISTEKLIEGFNLLLSENFEMVLPVVEYDFPIQRSLKFKNTDKKNIEYAFPEYAVTRSQDLPERFHDIGQFYWFNIKSILKSKSLFVDNTGAIVLDRVVSQDIDNMEDWTLTELKYRMLNGI